MDGQRNNEITQGQTTNFIKNIIDQDQADGKHDGRVVTRFPPEPNGYLHIGHSKSICLNFGVAADYNGTCHLRLDDTNPAKESDEYVRAILDDLQWLGFDGKYSLFHASDYFDHLYECAEKLIQKGKAYVCSLSSAEMREYRGTLTEPGRESPYRKRTVDENLDLFRSMKNGEFPDGAHLLRAKIDMTSGNVNLRDPAIYRIRHLNHQKTGDQWCIYPMYDYAHCMSDAKEGITHSLCTLEFEAHRPLYDWFLEQLDYAQRPQQIEFSRLNLNYTVMSKRKLKEIVDEKLVMGWDDPRMPTLKGLRRRGCPPSAIRRFCERIGVSKKDTVIDMSILEECIREELNTNAPRGMAVLEPIKLTIEDYEVDKVELITAPVHPKKPEMGTRTFKMTRNIWIDRNDFEEHPDKKFFRLAPGKEVRLRNSYTIKCERVIKDEQGEIVEIICSHDPLTRGKAPEGRKVKGVIHWLSIDFAVPAKFNIYDRLFLIENPDNDPEGRDYKQLINPNSLVQRAGFVEPSIQKGRVGQSFQFERLGYFAIDNQANPTDLVINKTVSLRDPYSAGKKK
jgi:glutaminyl-tRNA synthetase